MLEQNEIYFWEKCFIAKLSSGSRSDQAALAADNSVLQRRERLTPVEPESSPYREHQDATEEIHQ